MAAVFTETRTPIVISSRRPNPSRTAAVLPDPAPGSAVAHCRIRERAMLHLRPALVVAVVCSGLVACIEQVGEAAEQEDVTSVTGGRDVVRETLVVVEPLEVGTVRDEVIVPSRVISRASVQVFPRLTGLPVTSVLVEEGDRVDLGQPLVTLFGDELSLTVAARQAAYDEAQRAVDQQALDAEELVRRIALIEERMEIQEREVARLEELGDLVTRKEVDDARVVRSQMETELGDALAQQRGMDIQLELAKIGERKAQIELDRAEQDLDHTTLLAPIAGVVAMRDIEIGEIANQSTPALQIVDDRDLILDLRIPQDAFARLAAGQPVVAHPVSGDEASYHGVVRTVNPVLDQDTGTVHVIVDMDEEPGLVAGLFVEARVITSERTDALMVSKRAVLYDDDQPFFFALGDPVLATDEEPEGDADAASDGTRVRKVPFEAGAATATRIEVLSDPDGRPIPPDLRVVVVGQENLKDGAAVRVVEEAY